MRVLVLGSGEERVERPGDEIVRLDINPTTRPDVVWDLDETPWPFANDSFDEVVATDVLEHLRDVMQAMDEIHRVCRHGAVVRVTTPHFSSANSFIDPTHRQHLALQSFEYWTGGNKWRFYTQRRFEKLKLMLVFDNTPGFGRIVNKVMRRVAARWPSFYEQRLAWIFPSWFISAELRVLKT